ncbi:hypothetical protein ACHWQZ_G007269 [Mnemiopsis leidyi]
MSMIFRGRFIFTCCLALAATVLLTGLWHVPLSWSSQTSLLTGAMSRDDNPRFPHGGSPNSSPDFSVLLDSVRDQDSVSGETAESQDTGGETSQIGQRKDLNSAEIRTQSLTEVADIDRMYFLKREEVEKRIRERMEHIKSTLSSCKPKTIHLTPIPLYQINEMQMSWCPVFKSGSTTWKMYFIDKLVPTHKSYNLKELDKRKLRIRLKGGSRGISLFNEREGNKRFTVVRHPLSRLISHAQNAAKDSQMIAMEKEWIARAILDNREKLIKSYKDKNEYQNEFRDYFLWLRSKRKGEFRITKGNVFLEPPYPILDDLINHIIRTDAHNGHWAPACRWCKLCEVDYDYIIKLEEEPLELWYLLEQLGLWQDRALFLKRANSSQHPANMTDSDVFERNLRSLNNRQRAWVNKYFYDDFVLFGYEKLKLESGILNDNPFVEFDKSAFW